MRTRTAMMVSAGALVAALGTARPCRRPGSRPLFSWWYGALARRADQGEIGRRRQRLVGQASGRVLDLGAGTGESFKHIPATVRELVALEPDPAMLRQARPRTAEAGIDVRIVRGASEQLPFTTATFDTVVACLVLCSVRDLDLTLAEIHRVLRPGGRLLLMEHVRAVDHALAEWQDLVQRPWSWLNGGCHPNRRTLAAIQEAGFRFGTLEHYGFPVLPHVQGSAVRP